MPTIRSISSLLLASIWIVSASSSAFAIGSGFIENRGQIDETVRYYALGSRMAVCFTEDAVVFDLIEPLPAGERKGADRPRDPTKGREPEEPISRRGCAVYMRFEGANRSPVIEGREKLQTEYNYFLGNDRSRWRTNVAAYEEVTYRDLWPGIDLVLREEEGGVAYNLEIAPGADPRAARFRYEGAARVTARNGESTWIETAVETLLHEPAIPGISEGRVGFEEPDPPAGDPHKG